MISSRFLPQDNFPNSGNKPEKDLSDLFFSVYQENLAKIHPNSRKTESVLSRELPIQSYGIADIVAVVWDPKYGGRFGENIGFGEIEFNPTIRSFEVKIKDWKKALQQAFRYKFFSNVSIVLLPKKNLRRPVASLEDFKKLKIGLWGFDMDKGTIEKVYTPRNRKPLSKKQYRNALVKTFAQSTSLLCS